MVLEKLQKLGLSEKEAQIYVAMFELGSSVVTDVAERAKINRSTAYVLIESLSQRGLVSVSERRGIKMFAPVAPDKLTKIAEAKFNEASEILKIGKQLSEDLAKLTKVEKSNSGLKVNVFEGAENVKTIHNNLLHAKGKQLTLISCGKDTGTPVECTDIRNFAKRADKSKILVSDTASVREKLNEIKITTGQEIFLAPDIDGEYVLSIQENKVTFISPTDDASFVTENAQFVKAITYLYELATGHAKRWNVKGESQKTTGAQEPHKEKVIAHAEKRFWNEK